MVLEMQKKLGDAIRAVLKQKYGLKGANVPLEVPPELKFGETAMPVALQLARTLRKAPKMIAQEIVAALGNVEGFAGFEWPAPATLRAAGPGRGGSDDHERGRRTGRRQRPRAGGT